MSNTKPKPKRHISNPLEILIAEYLDTKEIDFVHESENNGTNLDFYLPVQQVYIEVKEYHTDRVNEQLKQRYHIILLQGIEAVRAFTRL